MGLETGIAILGGLASAASAVKSLTAKTPKVSAQPLQDTAAARTASDQTRSALYQTEGGAAGSTLDPNQVGRRDTIFGN